MGRPLRNGEGGEVMKDVVLFAVKSVSACALIALAAWVGWNVWYVNAYTPEERATIEDVRRRLDAELFGDKSGVRPAERVCECNGISVSVETHRADAEEIRAFDVKVVAETLWLEARGEGDKGIRAVASVIRNRSVERGLSARDVCLERGQFSCWNGGCVLPSDGVRKSRMDADSTRASWELCVRLAVELVDGTFKPTVTATHYYNPKKCRPAWAWAMRSCVTIGRHRFGRV